jgi:hypothetical protein
MNSGDVAKSSATSFSGTCEPSTMLVQNLSPPTSGARPRAAEYRRNTSSAVPVGSNTPTPSVNVITLPLESAWVSSRPPTLSSTRSDPLSLTTTYCHENQSGACPPDHSPRRPRGWLRTILITDPVLIGCSSTAPSPVKPRGHGRGRRIELHLPAARRWLSVPLSRLDGLLRVQRGRDDTRAWHRSVVHRQRSSLYLPGIGARAHRRLRSGS